VAGRRLRFFVFIFFFGAVVALLLDEDDREAARNRKYALQSGHSYVIRSSV
jgi:hypothetical protein